jgi:hypothetical protein
MSTIKPLGSAPGLGALADVAQGDAVGAVPSTPVSAMSGLDAVFPAVFERVRGLMAGGAAPTPEAAVRLAVGEVLSTTLPGLDAPVRAGLAARVTEVIVDDPVLRGRLERLLVSEAP